MVVTECPLTGDDVLFQFCRFFVGFRRWEFVEPLMTGSAMFIPEDVRQVCRERVQDQCLWV